MVSRQQEVQAHEHTVRRKLKYHAVKRDKEGRRKEQSEWRQNGDGPCCEEGLCTTKEAEGPLFLLFVSSFLFKQEQPKPL